MPLRDIFTSGYKITGTPEDLNFYKIKQQDSSLLRQIRLITGNTSHFNNYIVFVNIDKKDKDIISELVINGFYINDTHFVISERSASMTRTGILSFVDDSIADELDRRITMDIKFDRIVLSKYMGYRGLFLSACHVLEEYFPKMIVVPDYFKIIPNQHIKYAYDKTIDFVDKEDRERTWIQKDIAEGYRDIEVNVFDGCGICHPTISRQIEQIAGSKTQMSSFIIRGPYIKGLVCEIDYESFFAERGVRSVTDIWGVEHDFSEPMIIITEGQYKGFKYFKKYGDERDWQNYWEKFHKYKHCLGVSKWNFTVDEEPVYTRGNYQILQDLDLPYEEFRNLANDSIDWVDKIIKGDPLYTYCFLGVYANEHNPKNEYVEAMLKNPMIIKEPTVKKYLLSLLTKYKDDMKCGKLWLKATFKFLLPDLIMLLEHIGGLEPVGCLKDGEFYSHDKNGSILGERLIERNPHICKSEHVILNGVENELINTYCAHLDNVCMINGYSITPQRLNGADYDGDLVFVIDNQLMMKGVDRNAPVVLDIEDKVTALAEADTPENRVQLILRTINSLIGETSNCSTCFHNRQPKSKEARTKYESYIDLLSIINGKAILERSLWPYVVTHSKKVGEPINIGCVIYG